MLPWVSLNPTEPYRPTCLFLLIGLTGHPTLCVEDSFNPDVCASSGRLQKFAFLQVLSQRVMALCHYILSHCKYLWKGWSAPSCKEVPPLQRSERALQDPSGSLLPEVEPEPWSCIGSVCSSESRRALLGRPSQGPRIVSESQKLD